MLKMSATLFPASLATKVWHMTQNPPIRCNDTFDLEAGDGRSEAGSSGHIQFPVAPSLVAMPHPMWGMWGTVGVSVTSGSCSSTFRNAVCDMIYHTDPGWANLVICCSWRFCELLNNLFIALILCLNLLVSSFS